MRIQKFVIWVLPVVVLTGCATAPQTRVNLPGDYFASRTNRIGVAISQVPNPDTSFPGASCLLCLATASLANGEMTTAVRAWPNEELAQLKGELVAALTKRGQQAVAIDAPIDMEKLPDRPGSELGYSRKDFAAIKDRAGVDRLLVVNLKALGAWRNYSAYVPTGAPRAVFRGEAYIVDLASHKLDWYQSYELDRMADGNWDEPPKFPGLTNAYFQVIEESKDAIKKDFSQ